MNDTGKSIEYLIVGSGICGLTIANILNDNGKNVMILDKGRAPGGRTATRRIQSENGMKAVFDYGAQYFTVHDSIFKKYVDQWIKIGLVKEWSKGFYKEGGEFKRDGLPRHIGRPNMRSIAAYLARDIKVFQSEKIISINWHNDKWDIFTERNNKFTSGTIILTSPVPQSLVLLSNSNVNIRPDVEEKLKNVQYNPCIALMLVCRKSSSINDPGGIWCTGEPVSWIADNCSKGISPDVNCMTIHAGPQFSRNNLKEDDEIIFRKLVDYCKELINTEIVDYHIHKWLYSQPSVLYHKPFEYINTPGPIYFAGDAFVAPKMEGAFLSGYYCAHNILNI